MLHTWGQNLLDHPHIHCIIPIGGLSKTALISAAHGSTVAIEFWKGVKLAIYEKVHGSSDPRIIENNTLN